MDAEGKINILMGELTRISSYQFFLDEFGELYVCRFGLGQSGCFAFWGL